MQLQLHNDLNSIFQLAVFAARHKQSQRVKKNQIKNSSQLLLFVPFNTLFTFKVKEKKRKKEK
jgi:hypothetical protein